MADKWLIMYFITAKSILPVIGGMDFAKYRLIMWKSIKELGLLNPVTVDKDHILIARLHRLEAVKLLEWPEVECTVSSLEGLQAELAEIDENFVRNDLSTLE